MERTWWERTWKISLRKLTPFTEILFMELDFYFIHVVTNIVRTYLCMIKKLLHFNRYLYYAEINLNLRLTSFVINIHQCFNGKKSQVKSNVNDETPRLLISIKRFVFHEIFCSLDQKLFKLTPWSVRGVPIYY